MAGLDCGKVSSISWSILQSGVDASLTISDYESHEASLYLKTLGVSSGPCGSASLAAVRRLTAADKAALGLTQDSVIVLLSTEGIREYDTPIDVSTDDPVKLTQTLVRINSANPMLGSTPGPGEVAIARFISAWLEHRDIDSHWIEPTKGRPSIVGVVRGSGGGGKSLMFNGHIDTVTNMGYKGDPLCGDIIDGRIYGRGSGDMKGGVAAALIALANAKTLNLRGDVIFAGVADEEANSIGTENVLKAGWRADGAIVNEPTNLDVINSHKGFVWLEVDIHGVAAHGSRSDLGIDAISHAGYFLVELDQYARRLQQSPGNPRTGPGSIHASTIKGGEEPSSYPAMCTVVLERRTIAGETPETVKQEVQTLLDKLVKEVPDFNYDLRVTFHRSAFDIAEDHPFCSLVSGVINRSLGTKAVFHGEPYWTDCALLADAGIPAVLWGPRGEGLHANEEWVEVESVIQVAQALIEIATDFCR
jgi:acetylornithine deacetylase/succinyl-diaminopimelate desuccinylase family protein